MLFIQAGGIKGSTQQVASIMAGFLRIMAAFTVIPALVSFYIFYGLLFNRYLSQKKIGLLCMVGLLTILLAGFTGFAALNLITKGSILAFNGFVEIGLMICFMSILSLIHGIIALVMKGFISWYGDIKIKETLKQQNFETELALVKSQLSPHFLFNTINNIDVLIEKDAAKASAYLNKLSDIMRFMLYETKPEKIPLEKELTYIGKYIDLQKIRSSNHNFVDYQTVITAPHWLIAPMLFIPFIENAFKHAVNKKSDQTITIKIAASENRIDFYCENQFGGQPLQDETHSGIGNELIGKRLKLIYPSSHTLDIVQEKNVYKVNLSIYAAN